MNPSRDQIDLYLKKILSSRYFKKSKISCDLLTYLVEATLNKRDTKEYTIGVELFGIKYENQSNQDSNIRVYIHNVRKRLIEYYNTEGEKDEFYFEIEKGKYQVNFVVPEAKEKPKRIFLAPFIFSIAVIIFLCVLLLIKTNPKPNFWQKSKVWSDFNNDKTLLVLGDYFVYRSDLPTGGEGIFRDFGINSESDYEELISKNPDLALSTSPSILTYLSKMAAFCQNDIQDIFRHINKPLSVKLLSDMQPEDLKDNNIIFIGNYKNTGIFEKLITMMEFPYKIDSPIKDIIFTYDPCTESYELPKSNLNTETDYALVMSFLGFNKNRFLFFLSSRDIGNISTTGIFANKEQLEEFELKYLKKKTISGFKALYKVEGINKTDLSYELLRVD